MKAAAELGRAKLQEPKPIALAHATEAAAPAPNKLGAAAAAAANTVAAALAVKMGAAAAVLGLPMTLAGEGGVGNNAAAPAQAVPPNEENGPLPPNAGEAPPPNVRQAAGAVGNENALLLLNTGEVQLLPKGKEGGGAVPLPALHLSAGGGGGVGGAAAACAPEAATAKEETLNPICCCQLAAAPNPAFAAAAELRNRRPNPEAADAQPLLSGAAKGSAAAA